MADNNELISVVLALRADVTDLKAKFGQAETTAKQSANGMAKAFQGVTVAIAGIGAAIVIFRKFLALGQGAIANAQREEQAQRKLASAIGFTSTALLNQAKALQATTTFGDENIVEAQALVGAFIKEEEAIKRLTPVILDFAAAKGMDLRSAADLVTKTIASGTNALARYGIQITDSKDRAVRMESTIVGLTKAFGGMSTALAQTPSGVLEQQKNILSDMSEEIGMRLIPMQIEWNNLLIDTLQGWGHIYTQVMKLLNPLDIAKQRDLDWHTQSRDLAFARAQNYQKMITQVKQLGAEGNKSVTLELDGKKQVFKTEEAIAELEKRRRIAVRTGAGEAKMVGDILTPPTGAGKAVKTPAPEIDPESAKKEAAEFAKRQVANINAALTTYSAELEVAFATIEEQYVAGSVTIAQYFDTKRSLLEESAKAEMDAAAALIDLETDKAKRTEMIAALDKGNAALQVKRIELTREEINAKKALSEQEQQNAADVREIQARVGELEIQTYTQKLDAELAALAAKHEKELQMLRDHGATVAQIKAAEGAQTQERVLAEQNAQQSYLTHSLSTVNDVVGQISSIYDQYYALVVQEEKQKMEAQISSARAAGASEEQLEALRKSLSVQANARAKKAWEKQKKADLASAIIGTALAVVSALQTKPFIVGLLMAGLATAAGAIQIATIAGQSYPGMAEGGIVAQGTTGTADDVHARLSRGEYVTPAKSVDYYGAGVMEAMRRRAVPRELFSGVGTYAARRPSIPAFAEGGLVTSPAGAAGGGGGTTIVNFLDSGVLDRYLASIDGQRAVMNVISKRSYEARNALGVTT